MSGKIGKDKIRVLFQSHKGELCIVSRVKARGKYTCIKYTTIKMDRLFTGLFWS